MNIKATKVGEVVFGYEQSKNSSSASYNNEIKITELKKVTPDFGVKTPQSYKSVGVSELENGLKLYSYKLANGHKVTVIPMENSPAIVKNYVNVGSMNETDDIKGISHFLEHMAFNGTNGTDGYLKLNRGDSFKKVDEMGGWTNASTNYALTDYVNSTPLLNDKDIEKQIQIIASMAEDLALSEDMVEKEKFPVCSEIDMILDSPETVAIDQTVRTLFNIRSSSDELVGGSVNHIQSLDRQKVMDYYNKYYTPDNMHLVITGNVNPDDVMQIVSKNFHSIKTPNGKRFDEKLIPIKETVRKDFITDKASSANIVLGFAGPSANDVKNSIISELITRYVDSTSAGISDELKKLNANYYISSEKISTNSNNPVFNYMHVECSDDTSEKVLKLLFDKISELKSPDIATLNAIKQSMITDFDDNLEDSLNLNTLAGMSAFSQNLEYLTNYKKIANEITQKDIENYINKYFNISKSAVTIVHPEVNVDKIINNYEKASELCFKGNKRTPVNTQKVSETILDNNYKLAFSKSKNNNTPFIINLYYDLPKNVNPAAFYVLDRIYSKGTKNLTEEEFLKVQEKNNINIKANLSKGKLTVSGYSPSEKFDFAANNAIELIKSPRMVDNDIDEEINKIKDLLSRYDITSDDLYKGYEAKNNPYYDSITGIVEGLKTLTADDVRNLHNYIMKNAKGTISVNIPENKPEIEDVAIRNFASLENVKPYAYSQEKIYKTNDSTAVISKSRNISQADISSVYKFKTDGSIKSKVAAQLMNSILSNSDSIGLFNSLREQDHLAYRVNSSLDYTGDCGEISLHILTSTDNKETGKKSYDNVKKSIIGFQRQINKLVNSEYNDDDLETAKRKLKANLLDKESVYSRLGTISHAQYLNENLDYENRVFEIIDSITRDDIDELSSQVFANKPVYSIVASQDTLDYNENFLNGLN